MLGIQPAATPEASVVQVCPHPDDMPFTQSRGRVHSEDLDRQVIRFMVKKFGMGEKQISYALCCRTSTTIVNTYNLILNRRLRGLGYPDYPMDELKDTWGVAKNVQERRSAIERIRHGLSETNGQGQASKSASGRRVLHFPTSIVPPPEKLFLETPSPDKFYCRTPILEKIPVGPVEKSRPITTDCTKTTADGLAQLRTNAEASSHKTEYRTLRLDLRDMSPPLCPQQRSQSQSMLSRVPKLRANADEIYKDYLQKLRHKKLVPGRGILKNDVLSRPPLMIEKPGQRTRLIQKSSDVAVVIPRADTRPGEGAKSQYLTTPLIGGGPQASRVDTPCRALETPLPDVEVLPCNMVHRMPSAKPKHPPPVSRSPTKSAKSVRFRDDTPCSEVHLPQEPVDRYAMRRLSAHHARSRKDMLFVARLQAEKQSVLKQFDTTLDPKAQYRRWLQYLDDGSREDTEVCPAPPNSVLGFHAPNQASPRAPPHRNTTSLSEPLPVLKFRQSKDKASRDANLNEDVFCETYRKKHQGQKADRVVVWDVDMLDLDLSGERIAQKPKGDYFVRRLGTIPPPSQGSRGSISGKSVPLRACYQILKIAGCACAGNVFPATDFKGNRWVSDPDMHHSTCFTHGPWCMSGSLTRGGGENVPSIPGACATLNFTYMTRGPFIKETPSHW